MAALALIEQLQAELSKPKPVVSTAEIGCQTEILFADHHFKVLFSKRKPYLPHHADHLPKRTSRKCLKECPQCHLEVSTPSGIEQEFGLKSNGQCQSWCKKCRRGNIVSLTDHEKENLNPEVIDILENMSTTDLSEGSESPKSEEDKLFHDSSEIMHRHDNIFVFENSRKPFLDTLKRKNETWDDAEWRHRQENHPLIGKRQKLLELLQNEHNLTPKTMEKRYGDTPTVKLFYDIKKDSPMLLTKIHLKTP